MPDSLSLARKCAGIAYEKRAEDIIILDLRSLTDVTDFFVIATCSPAQSKSIVEEIRKTLKASGHKGFNPEGDRNSGWMLLDYIDVIVHLFESELRAYYDIENLWGDAPRIELEV